MDFLTFTRRGAALFACDASLLYDVLTDYDAYAEWVPLVAKSKLLATEGDLAIAEFEFLRPANDTFVIECVHTRNKMVLWRTIRGRIPLIEARCDIEPAGDGQSRLSITFEGRRGWSSFASGYSAFLNTSRFLKALPTQLSAFSPEIATDEGEKILEITDTADGVVCWMRGKKYILTPEPEGEHRSS